MDKRNIKVGDILYTVNNSKDLIAGFSKNYAVIVLEIKEEEDIIVCTLASKEFACIGDKQYKDTNIIKQPWNKYILNLDVVFKNINNSKELNRSVKHGPDCNRKLNKIRKQYRGFIITDSSYIGQRYKKITKEVL